MGSKINYALKKSKSVLIIMVILWIALSIVLIAPLSITWVEAVVQGQGDFMEKMVSTNFGDVFGEPAIVTDTHCIRLTNRMGLVDGIKEPKKVEMELWKIIPPEEGSDFCHRLVYHGRAVCTARTNPYCDKCCLNDICPKNGVKK